MNIPAGRMGPFALDSIVCGDALGIMAAMPDGCVDLVVTDPPYGINYVSAWPKHSWDIHVPIANDDETIWESWPEIAEELYRVAKNNTALFVFTRWDMWEKIEASISPWVVKNMIVWDKGTHTAGDLDGNYGYAHELICFATKGRPLMRGRRVWNTWRCPKVPPTQLTHSMEKPVGLIAIAVRTMSDKGDLVFDPFMGSGTTAAAAKNLGRHWIGCDINPAYVDMANARVAKVTGIQLALEGTE